jgi:hypothetical protein
VLRAVQQRPVGVEGVSAVQELPVQLCVGGVDAEGRERALGLREEWLGGEPAGVVEDQVRDQDA